MTILAMESFGFCNTVDDLEDRGWELFNAGNITLLPAGGPESQPAVQFSYDGTSLVDVRNTYHYGDMGLLFDAGPITNPTALGGILFRVDSLPSNGLMGIFGFEGTLSDYTHVYARINYEGNLYIQTPGNLSTDAFPITVGEWYHLELKALMDNPGEAEARVNGLSIGTISGDIEDTDTTFDLFRIGATDENSYNFPADGGFTVCDFYGLQVDATAPNDWIGEAARVGSINPNGEGATIQFSPTTGSDNSAMVDDPTRHDYDTTRNNARIAGKKDTFDVTNLSVSLGSIHAIKVTAIAKKGDTTSKTINIVQRYSSSETDSSALTLTEEWAPHSAFFATNPSTSSMWTKTEFATAQFGYKIAT